MQPGSGHISNRSSQLKDIIAIVGLPRSGTTMAASLLDAHPQTVVCYEPWNRVLQERKAKGDGADDTSPVLADSLTPGDLVEQFGLKVSKDATCFVLKETSVDFKGMQWLQRFLRHNSGDYRVRVVWSLRSYRHTYLSFVEGAREWWGHDDMHVELDTYDRWVQRADKATALIQKTYQQFQGAVYSYESLSADLPGVLPLLMDALGMSFHKRQLDYRKHIAREQVRGDRGMAENPRPVSDSSTQSREAEWQAVEAQLSQSKHHDLRARLDACWSAVHSQQVWTGALPINKLLQGDGQVSTSAFEQENGLLLLNPSTREYRLAFRSESQWQRFIGSQEHLVNTADIAAGQERVAREGFVFRAEQVPPYEHEASGAGVVSDGMDGPDRAVLLELLNDLRRRGLASGDVDVFAPQAPAGLAQYLGREFSPGGAGDLTGSSVDYLLVSDAVMRAPDPATGLAQYKEMLRPGGCLLGVCSIFQQDKDADSAGWEILDLIRKAGFEDGALVYVSSPSHGVLADGISGVMVLRAVRAA